MIRAMQYVPILRDTNPFRVAPVLFVPEWPFFLRSLQQTYITVRVVSA